MNRCVYIYIYIEPMGTRFACPEAHDVITFELGILFVFVILSLPWETHKTLLARVRNEFTKFRDRIFNKQSETSSSMS